MSTSEGTAAASRSDPVQSFIQVLSREPFVIRRRVRWGDCDPAGVVYTGRFTEFLLDAVMLFFADLGNGAYHQWVADLGVDTPCKGMEFTFHHALWPDDWFDMTCTVPQVREHGYDIAVEATGANRMPIFSARFSPICIRRDIRQRAPIPPEMLVALARHRPAAAAS